MLIYRGSFSVFSTYVEVILTLLKPDQGHRCILHVCGGDPSGKLVPVLPHWYSPRMWR